MSNQHKTPHPLTGLVPKAWMESLDSPSSEVRDYFVTRLGLWIARLHSGVRYDAIRLALWFLASHDPDPGVRSHATAISNGIEPISPALVAKLQPGAVASPMVLPTRAPGPPPEADSALRAVAQPNALQYPPAAQSRAVGYAKPVPDMRLPSEHMPARPNPVKVVITALLGTALLIIVSVCGLAALIGGTTRNSPERIASTDVTAIPGRITQSVPTAYPTQTPQPTYTPYPTLTPLPTYTRQPTLTPAPTETPRPTSTPTPIPTSTPAPTFTPRPVPTPTSAPPALIAQTSVNVMREPVDVVAGNNLLGTLPAGSYLPVTARSTDGLWWKVYYNNASGWVRSGSSASPIGAMASVPFIALTYATFTPIPAPPTAVPQAPAGLTGVCAGRSPGQRYGATCRDGWHSSSTGSGTCSSHGGVAVWLTC
jgi:hypothetical protein